MRAQLFPSASKDYEMNGIHNSTTLVDYSNLDYFLSEVSNVQAAIARFDANVSNISRLQNQVLNNLGDEPVQQELDKAVADIRELANDLKRRIKTLQASGSDTRDGKTRRAQSALLKDQFTASLQAYRKAEQSYRTEQRTQLERQIKIVKPNATEGEIKAAVDHDSGGQIFQQALMNSDQFGKARTVYNNAQERHHDLQRIERTMADLQDLMEDMALHVHEQGEKVTLIEKNAAKAKDDIENGQDAMDDARRRAAQARKKRIICFMIFIIILLIIGAALGIYFGTHNNRN